ncbi:MAG: methyltransferase [Anaerolineae bacterium]|nr:methyltransferase [Anaerolineae bacterium]
MTERYVLSYVHAAPLLLARQAGEATARTSLDLGLTTSEVHLGAERVVFSDGQWLRWEAVEEIAEDESVCYAVEDNAAVKIQRFSGVSNMVYVLMPTQRAPTVLVSGIQMHRVRDTDPWQDTLEKIRALSPLQGRVLDTCTGLGYTAIAAAKTAQSVTTIELDSDMLEIARLNPWSAPLFEHPKISQVVGDSYEEVERFEASSFARIIHDPPMLNRAGELYSSEFYRRLYRILKDRGRLYHYVGDPESRSGRNTIRGVSRRLRDAGFQRVDTRARAFGVVAYK